MNPHDANRVRRCRICGCTQNRACMTQYGPCYWVEYDLCSACVLKDQLSKDYIKIRAARENEGTAILATCHTCGKEISIPWLQYSVPCNKVREDIELNLKKKGWSTNKKFEAFCPEHNLNEIQQSKKRADKTLSELSGRSTTCDDVFKAGGQ